MNGRRPYNIMWLPTGGAVFRFSEQVAYVVTTAGHDDPPPDDIIICDDL